MDPTAVDWSQYPLLVIMLLVVGYFVREMRSDRQKYQEREDKRDEAFNTSLKGNTEAITTLTNTVGHLDRTIRGLRNE